jgi:hypothetical protein
MARSMRVFLAATVALSLGVVGVVVACPGGDGAGANAQAKGTKMTLVSDKAEGHGGNCGGNCRGKCDPASCDPATCDPSKCGGASGGGCLGAGKGFVDADGDGINDNSPLAKLDLSVEQKAQIAEILASGSAPRHEAVFSVLTEEQRADLQAIRAAGGAAHGGGCHGAAGGKCDPATCDPSKCKGNDSSCPGHGASDGK